MTRLGVGRIVAYAAVVLVGAGGLWRVESTANRADATAKALEREIVERQADDCRRAVQVRAETEQLLVHIAEDVDAGQEIIDLIERRYGELPPPVDC